VTGNTPNRSRRTCCSCRARTSARTPGAGNHSPAFEAVRDALADRLGAERDHVTGAKHTTPHAGPAINDRVERSLHAAEQSRTTRPTHQHGASGPIYAGAAARNRPLLRVGLDVLPERFSDVVEAVVAFIDGLAADDVMRWSPTDDRWVPNA
jgi:hypothetical protein